MGLWFADRLVFPKFKTLAWVKTPVNLILVMFLVLIGFQLIPLPASVTELISPHTYADKKQLFTILAKSSNASAKGLPGMMLSYYSHATVVEWLKLAAYFGMFFLVLNTVTSKQKIDILVYTIILIGLFQAVYAVYQMFSITPKVWWWKSRGRRQPVCLGYVYCIQPFCRLYGNGAVSGLWFSDCSEETDPAASVRFEREPGIFEKVRDLAGPGIGPAQNDLFLFCNRAHRGGFVTVRISGRNCFTGCDPAFDGGFVFF